MPFLIQSKFRGKGSRKIYQENLGDFELTKGDLKHEMDFYANFKVVLITHVDDDYDFNKLYKSK